MRYAKYISRTKIIPYRDKTLHIGGKIYINPTAAAMKKAGWLPVYESNPFSDVQTEAVYEKRGDRIYIHHIRKEVTTI